MTWAQKFHLTMAVVWALLLIPTIMYWRNSVLWVGFMSIYACIFIHIDGYHSSGKE